VAAVLAKASHGASFLSTKSLGHQDSPTQPLPIPVASCTSGQYSVQAESVVVVCRKDIAHIWEIAGGDALTAELTEGSHIFLTHRQARDVMHQSTTRAAVKG